MKKYIKGYNEYATQIDEIVSALEQYTCEPGNEFEYETENISVWIWWHHPSLNLGYYPIGQIDINDKTVFNREGGEGWESAFGKSYGWDSLVYDIIRFLRNQYGG